MEETQYNKTLATMRAKLARVRASDKMEWIISSIDGSGRVMCAQGGGGFSITSDGHVLSGDLFLGSVVDFERNIRGFASAAKLDDDELALFATMYSEITYDWRTFGQAKL